MSEKLDLGKSANETGSSTYVFISGCAKSAEYIDLHISFDNKLTFGQLFLVEISVHFREVEENFFLIINAEQKILHRDTCNETSNNQSLDALLEDDSQPSSSRILFLRISFLCWAFHCLAIFA